jgi:superfamily I DNA/RNA helicase
VIICFDPEKDRKRDFSNLIERNNIKRLIYVGMTRAKNNLILLGNAESNPYFRFLYDRSIKEEKENLPFLNDEPTEISLITSCRDVTLGYNRDHT